MGLDDFRSGYEYFVPTRYFVQYIGVNSQMNMMRLP
jgi:hypothetical protein